MSFQVLNLRLLSSGGNGDVYVGDRSDNGERAVVKYLREFNLPHARKAFVREIGVLARRLPGVVPLLGWDINAERPYYIMPYFAGGPLSRWAGRLTDTQLQNVAHELGVVIANLHANSIVHGDIKPDNVLVSPAGQLQLGDPLGNGGLCTVLFSQNRGGTPGYWAPEVQAGASISYIADVYSYGATLYELLTARKPLDGRRLDPTAAHYVKAPRVRQVIANCCHPDPNARPSMQDVLRILQGEGWLDIQAARKKTQGVLAAACLIGLVLFGLAAADA